jgi:S-DNA-T family DNA segregation ATPase FtsK/SpoIIIE
LATKGRKPASKKGAPKRTSVRTHLSPFASDAFGIGLVVVAILAALALWFGSDGFGLRGLEYLARGAVGIAAVTIPLLLLFWGFVLIKGTDGQERVRMFMGFVITLFGILGLVSLFTGHPSNPSPLSGQSGVRDAAGMFGAIPAYPMSQVLSVFGAAIVCAGLTVLGLLVFSGTRFSDLWARLREFSVAEEGDEEEEDEPKPKKKKEPKRRVLTVDEDEPADLAPEMAEPEPERIEALMPERAKAPADRGEYVLPPMDLLRTAPASSANGLDEEHTMEALERTFNNFGVAASVPTAHRGPTVTLYEVEVEAGTKVNKVLSLADDIAYALATPDVRIIAPIPGKSAIGVEVPNKVRDFVMLGDVLRSKAARDEDHPLTVALGKDVHGRAVMVNLSTMPHVLIAGATGAGKSSLINTFITSILMRATPDDVRLMLVDPKRVELANFADIPHLLAPVIVNPKRAAEALGWVVREMEMRYESLAMVGVRDIYGYEEGLAAGTLRIPLGQESKFGHMPFLLVVIDELADLMMVAPRAVEDAIARIAQMARAVGIHLVVATQRPSVDVVTGLIKANIPSRIAFMTASQTDSRVILDVIGADKLVGHGDMLFLPANSNKPSRIQGAWVTEKEVVKVTDWVRAQRETRYSASVEGMGNPPAEGDDDLSGDDELLMQAQELVIRSQLGSTSMLQRKLKVGFARAGRLMDLMEEGGVVGPSLGSKAREVLITPEEWEERSPRSRSV